MGYIFPALDLLDNHKTENKFMDREYVQAMAEELSSTLESFKVKCRITDVRMTPFAVLFDVMPDPGVSVKAFKNLRLDLEVHMASPVEIVGIGEKEFTIGIAIKNWERPLVSLREIMESKEFLDNDYKIPIAAGIDVLGKPFLFDLAATPHLLVAGTTGSGKSTFIHDIVMSVVYSRTPDEVRFLMIDPKLVELQGYNAIPHMLMQVISRTDKAIDALQWTYKEMKDRYDTFASKNVKNIDAYNQAVLPEERIPRIVIIVDEYMEMMFWAPKELKDYIKQLSRLARASGIHLVLATQRPSSDVITNDIKTNIPCRASFTVVDWRESKTILDRTGAERLLGNGDMLYSATDSAIPIHAQAAYVSYEEIDKVISAIS